MSFFESLCRLATTQEARAADYVGLSQGPPDAVLRCGCKVILALVRGKSPPTIEKGGLFPSSQVNRVAHRICGSRGQRIPDRREDNAENKVTEL